MDDALVTNGGRSFHMQVVVVVFSLSLVRSLSFRTSGLGFEVIWICLGFCL